MAAFLSDSCWLNPEGGSGKAPRLIAYVGLTWASRKVSCHHCYRKRGKRSCLLPQARGKFVLQTKLVDSARFSVRARASSGFRTVFLLTLHR